MQIRRRRLTLAAASLVLPAAVARRAAAAPAVRWTDIALLDGSTLSAAHLASRAVVVQFWATWCPFCARQNPHLQRLHQRQVPGLQVLGLSIEADPAPVRAYVARHGYSFPVAMADARSAAWFPDRKGLPVIYVVDRQGRIALHEAGEMFPEDVTALARFAQPDASR